MSTPKAKVNRANILTASSFEPNSNLGNITKARIGNNITIIKPTTNYNTNLNNGEKPRASPSVVSSTTSKVSRATVNLNQVIRPGVAFQPNRQTTKSSNSQNSSFANEPMTPYNVRSPPNSPQQGSIPQPLQQVLNQFLQKSGLNESENFSDKDSHISSGSSYVSDTDTETDVSNLSSNIAVEARVNRKILDLEISNKSLLSYNQILESKVRSQEKEIEELKINIRRLNAGVTDAVRSSPIEDDPNSGEESDNSVDNEQFTRLFKKMDFMIDDAKSALNFTSTINGGKVLPNVVDI